MKEMKKKREKRREVEVNMKYPEPTICIHIYVHSYIYIYIYLCTYICIYILNICRSNQWLFFVSFHAQLGKYFDWNWIKNTYENVYL